MSPDHITAGAYNRDIDKRLARTWSRYARLKIAMTYTAGSVVEILLGIASDDSLTYFVQNCGSIIAAYPATLGSYFLIDALHWHIIVSVTISKGSAKCPLEKQIMIS